MYYVWYDHCVSWTILLGTSNRMTDDSFQVPPRSSARVERNDWKFLLLLTGEFSRYMGIFTGIQPPSGILQAVG